VIFHPRIQSRAGVTNANDVGLVEGGILLQSHHTQPVTNMLRGPGLQEEKRAPHPGVDILWVRLGALYVS